MDEHVSKGWSKTVLAYCLFMVIPLYWLLVLSLQPNEVSARQANLLPRPVSLQNYLAIFFQENWTDGYINALIYVSCNIVITLFVALPAAYAFSRYKFIGSNQAFFFAFIFRMIPPAIIIVPLVQMFSAAQLIDTYIAVALAHSMFTIPIAIWILEGVLSSVPGEMEEIAQADGYTKPGFFLKILIPQIKTGIAVAVFFCFMFSWVELTIANALTTVTTKPIGAVMRIVAEPLGQVHIGISSAASILMIIPGFILVWFLRNHLARGFSMGRIGSFGR